MTEAKTLMFVLTMFLTGETVADFLASKPLTIVCILVVIAFWRFVLLNASERESNSHNSYRK